MSEEFEIVWNGVHGNADKDLLLGLCPSYTVPASTSSLPTPLLKEEKYHRPKAVIDAELEAVLTCLQRESCTRWQLRQITGFSEQSVAIALNRLKKEQRIRQVSYGYWRAK